MGDGGQERHLRIRARSAPGQVAGAANYTNGLSTHNTPRPTRPRSPRAPGPERSRRYRPPRTPRDGSPPTFSCRYTTSTDLTSCLPAAPGGPPLRAPNAVGRAGSWRLPRRENAIGVVVRSLGRRRDRHLLPPARRVQAEVGPRRQDLFRQMTTTMSHASATLSGGAGDSRSHWRWRVWAEGAAALA